MGLIKHHHTRHRSDHRGPKKKLKRVLKNGFIHFTVPAVLITIISIAHRVLIEHCNLLILRGVTLLVVLWCAGGFFVLAGGILLWLRVKAG
jgi:hypothetical protein